MLFDWFEEGHVLGRHRVCLDEQMFERWEALFPDEGNAEVMPPGMASPVMMQAYAAILNRKPPGNIHGGQIFSFRGFPRRGEQVTTEFRCLSKTLRNGRRWLELGLTSSSDSGEVYWTGKMTVLWAQ
ncbi:MAG: hypothetical protein QM682_00260 [Paracoccus sp. (in: a-proteobacteria)]|uniref:hypothetical protein n=1 Tax=Paracoccus sp. TaxID=267 RepID=UPI0039E559AA